MLISNLLNDVGCCGIFQISPRENDAGDIIPGEFVIEHAHTDEDNPYVLTKEQLIQLGNELIALANSTPPSA